VGSSCGGHGLASVRRGSTSSENVSGVVLRLSSFSVGTSEKTTGTTEEVAESEALEKATLLLLSASLEGCLSFLEELREVIVLLVLALSVFALSLALAFASVEGSVASCEVCSYIGGTSIADDFRSI
jgi:hypothetical protein